MLVQLLDLVVRLHDGGEDAQVDTVLGHVGDAVLLQLFVKRADICDRVCDGIRWRGVELGLLLDIPNFHHWDFDWCIAEIPWVLCLSLLWYVVLLIFYTFLRPIAHFKSSEVI
jgi:hypothetical protein